MKFEPKHWAERTHTEIESLLEIPTGGISRLSPSNFTLQSHFILTIAALTEALFDRVILSMTGTADEVLVNELLRLNASKKLMLIRAAASKAELGNPHLSGVTAALRLWEHVAALRNIFAHDFRQFDKLIAEVSVSKSAIDRGITAAFDAERVWVIAQGAAKGLVHLALVNDEEQHWWEGYEFYMSSLTDGCD